MGAHARKSGHSGPSLAGWLATLVVATSVQAQPAPEEAVPSEASDESDATPAEAITPVDIFAVMRAGGWDLAVEEDLADYLPIPPRAEGQIGHFVRGESTLSVARVTYPAEIFADPHESWIRERMLRIADAHERVVRRGATVVHVRAESEAVADEVARLFETAMAGAGEDG